MKIIFLWFLLSQRTCVRRTKTRYKSNSRGLYLQVEVFLHIPSWGSIITRQVEIVHFLYSTLTILGTTTTRKSWMVDGVGGKRQLIARESISSCITNFTISCFLRDQTWSSLTYSLEVGWGIYYRCNLVWDQQYKICLEIIFCTFFFVLYCGVSPVW